MSDKGQSRKNDGTTNVKEKGKSKDDGAKPSLLLFGKDVSPQDIVAAIKAESERQLETGDIGRRMVRIKKGG
jgi:hypothetical protein